MVELIEHLGFQLLVRDNSFMDFPAYSLYVPSMTELHNTHSLRYLETTYEHIKDRPDEWFAEMFDSWEDVAKGSSEKFVNYLGLVRRLKECAIQNSTDQQLLQSIFQ